MTASTKAIYTVREIAASMMIDGEAVNDTLLTLEIEKLGKEFPSFANYVYTVNAPEPVQQKPNADVAGLKKKLYTSLIGRKPTRSFKIYGSENDNQVVGEFTAAVVANAKSSTIGISDDGLKSMARHQSADGNSIKVGDKLVAINWDLLEAINKLNGLTRSYIEGVAGNTRAA